MQQLTPAGQNLVNDIASRYNLSTDSVINMLIAVNNGGGSMAQFNCPELGGSGQWMRGGMTMVGDMFNNGLKNTVDNLCNELANALANMEVFPKAPAGTRGSNQWWPSDLGVPFSSGAQNNLRYAIFPNRLAVDINGQVTVYDTLDNNISGVSQQQGGNTSLTFSSQYGTISVSSLPIVSGPGFSPAPAPQTNFLEPLPPVNTPEPVKQNLNTPSAPSTSGSMNLNSSSSNEIIQLIEKLSQLRDAGALTDDEYNTKKTDLLNRL
ncbi:SHOCT domain-containing protein [Neptunomonas qingdaonensis]|uniref:Short C-terminal domain-containing protein n=1 Tax=Neptunomonas qingdaonensis TaxID=1045558 RepID=A0A1I2RJT4_9GAMM|nr:SHOCT domain-containing protein [Neptunomonas qingdaonensis]SFG38036.1 Short C-terminal domain-containing protein [Neptunomonas qingdaonensis]